MTAIAETPFAKLGTKGRLLTPILKADTHVAGRDGYRHETLPRLVETQGGGVA